MSKSNEEIIEWLVEFAQMDLSNLTAGDKAKLAIDVKEYLFIDDEIEQVTGNIERFSPDLNENIKEELEKTKDVDMCVFMGKSIEYLENTYKRYPLSRVKQVLNKENQKEFWELISVAQSLIYAFLKVILIITNDPAYIAEKHDNNLLNKGNITISILSVVDGKINYLRIPIATHLYEYFATKLYSLVSGLEVTAIRKCLGCGRIFFNPSLREKKFCSSRCQSRFHAANRREAKRNKKKEGNS